MARVAIFWDYESCSLPENLTGYEIISSICRIAHAYGSITMFKVYMGSSNTSHSQALRSQFEALGLSLMRYTRKDEPKLATQVLIADMLAYAIDNPTPATIVLISGNTEFAYSISLLRLRQYQVVLIGPSAPGIYLHESLKSQASAVLDWGTDIVQTVFEKKVSKIFPRFGAKVGERGNPPGDFKNEIVINNSIDNGPIKNTTWSRPEWSGDAGNRFLVPDSAPGTSAPINSTWRRNTAPNMAPSKPIHLRRLSSMIGDSAVPSGEQENGIEFGQSSHSEKIGSVAPNVAVPPNMPIVHQSSTRIGFMPFSNFNDFSIGFSDRKRRVLDSEIPLSQKDATLDEISAPTLPSLVEKTVLDSSQSSPDWTRVSRDASSQLASQGNAPQTDILPHVGLPSVLPSPKVFSLLVEQLEKLQSNGNTRPLRSLVGCELANKSVYMQAGVTGFGQYAALAESMGIVQLGGTGGKAWIALRANWRDAFQDT